MIVFPQLANGAVSQYPFRKVRRNRTVVNHAADGRSIRLADPAGETTEWLLQYTELSDDELAVLTGFFISAEGALSGFTFLDPASNLLAWSEDLGNAVWQKGPLLSAAAGAGVWRLSNAGDGPQELAQTINAPGAYVYCFNASVRSAAPVEVTLAVGSRRVMHSVAQNWAKLVLASTGDVGAESMCFALEIPAGASVDVRGIQAEAQPCASVYKASTRGGVYEGARFSNDALEVITTGPNRHSCTVKIIHANHL